jgi:polyisoprenoid-binding protein YceI
MRGPRVLDAARFATITARSRQVAVEQAGDAGSYRVNVTIDLGLHGVTRALTVPVLVTLQGDRLTATGGTELRQTDYGMQPVSAGGGTVKVKDAVKIDFTIVAVAGP